jgi:hypothetical protein
LKKSVSGTYKKSAAIVKEIIMIHNNFFMVLKTKSTKRNTTITDAIIERFILFPDNI